MQDGVEGIRKFNAGLIPVNVLKNLLHSLVETRDTQI